MHKQNIEDTKETNEVGEQRIQIQAWGIIPQIRKVDEFLDMNPGAGDRLHETHPTSVSIR